MAIKDLTKEERLGRLAKLLRAQRDPYYVTYPIPANLRREFPAEGWYWIPPDGTRVELLARDSYDAYHRLLTMIEALDHDQEQEQELAL